MAINPLQLPSTQSFVGDLGLAQSLGQLGQVFKQNQNQQKLSDLGKGLASGAVDYKQAAALTADMGDVTHTLQFLALAEQQKKQGLEQAAAADFSKGLGGLYGANPAPAVPSSNPMPQPGRPTGPIPAVPAGAPVPSSSRVVGDAEGVASGLYDPPAAPGLRPPVQTADATLPTAAAPAQGRLPTAPVDTTGQPGAQHVPVLLQALANPNLPATQKETAKLLLTEAFKNMKPPEKIQTLRAMQADPSLADLEMKLKEAGKTTVNVDTKGETKFEEKFGEGQAKRWNGYIEESQNAERKLADIQSMREISQRIGSQGAKANLKEAVGPYAEALGIPIDGLSDIQAYSSVIQRLAPQQRAAGSGSTSDIEFKGFLKSLPTLSQHPEAREVTLNTMEAFARDDIARGEIASRLATKEINRGQAEREMRALPDPMKGFTDWRKANPDAYGQALKGTVPASVTPKDSGAAKEVPFTKVEIDQSLSNARARIARDPGYRDTAIKILRQNGIDPSGL